VARYFLAPATAGAPETSPHRGADDRARWVPEVPGVRPFRTR
jgi:hypothetical protein